ncbi:uncharacterized protein BJ212DRAFT_1321811 [Suillus subaureus]|uniref:EamA domain-containing protein n=1 Tax=Suillus subaureus TaxID=48587 RepID=A0A9P7ELF9_9AGAM|nr:uncharacterized protein BJ212DRAFT_1321811 [Suillus subaureus]KAG1824672.1 hypothetical protein BJ212DRAFT_1321811 [Suillus subaureus]
MSDSESSPNDNATYPTYLRPFDGVIADDGRPSVTGITADNIGMLFIVSAQFFYVCVYSAVKILNGLEPRMHTFQVITIRMTITFICCVVYMPCTNNGLQLMTRKTIMRIPDPVAGSKAVRALLVLRGTSGCVPIYAHDLDFPMIFPWSRFFGLYGMYWSLQYLAVADATVLLFLTPLMTAVVGSILLKESYFIDPTDSPQYDTIW